MTGDGDVRVRVRAGHRHRRPGACGRAIGARDRERRRACMCVRVCAVRACARALPLDSEKSMKPLKCERFNHMFGKGRPYCVICLTHASLIYMRHTPLTFERGADHLTSQ